MTPTPRNTLTTASVVGLMLALLFVTAITIIADLHTPIKDWLKNTHGHHWVGKGIWTVGLFVVATIIAYPLVQKRGTALNAFMMRLAANIAIAGSLLLIAFFFYEYFKH